MNVELNEQFQHADWSEEARQILRTCVHCGFCTAVCPTYQLLGNELDSPRGRIYLIHSMLEGNITTQETQYHLDRCLTCRACEASCPSGVRYGRLSDIARELIDQQIPRPRLQRVQRWALRQAMSYPKRFAALLALGRIARPFLPAKLKAKIPVAQKALIAPKAPQARKVLMLEGCVQPSLAPNINIAAQQVLYKLGISVLKVPNTGCCGALSYHLAAHEEGLGHMRRLIDAWYPLLDQVEAIIITASGCGSMLKEYGELFKDDPHYAEKAMRISSLAKDISEVVAQEDLSQLQLKQAPKKQVAVHVPCSLQHAQRVVGVLESVVQRIGFETTPVADGHLCCGSAGVYSILQPEISQQLLGNKVQALESGKPEFIVTANIGCLMHLQSGSSLPVRHWVELVAENLL
jgi:glycolate oxidase iron-sulfur subunit